MNNNYTLEITCPLCGTVGKRRSSAPFIYLDEEGIQEHSQHTVDCKGNNPTSPVTYTVVRSPDEYRKFPGDPLPQEGVS